MKKILDYIIRAFDRTGDANKSARDEARNTSKSVMSNMANIKAAWDMATAAVAGAAKRLWSAVAEAFRFETLTVQFAVLMGSMTKARDRMKELAHFAANTPFQMEEVVVASRQLHVFSDGALGATNSLRLVGDAAAAVGQKIQDVSFWVGRAYSLIKGGQPFGEAAMRLQEMGIITPDVRRKMEDLQAAGATNLEVWTQLASRLSEFSGGMAKLSLTGDGLVSTLKDTWTAAVRTFGQSFTEAAKTAISALIEWMGRLNSDGTIKAWADRTLDLLYRVAGAAKAIKEGGPVRAEAWGAVKDVLIGGLQVGAAKAVELLVASAPRIGALIAASFKGVAEEIVTPLKAADRRRIAIQSLGIEPLGEPQNNGLFWERKPRKLTPEEESQVKRRIAEMIQMETLDKSGVSQEPIALTGKDRLNRGLEILGKLGAEFDASVKDKTAELKRSAEEGAAAQADPRKAAEEQQRIAEDMARSQAVIDEKAAVESAKKIAEEKAKIAQKHIEDEHRLRIAAAKEEAEILAKAQLDARDRVNRALSSAQQAWGWYRDRDSFKRQLAEEKDEASAQKQFDKDFDRLKDRRRDWRTADRLSEGDEVVRRVALAREEQGRAEQHLANIAKQTAGLEEMLKGMLTRN